MRGFIIVVDYKKENLTPDVSFVTKGAARVDKRFVSECGEWFRSVGKNNN